MGFMDSLKEIKAAFTTPARPKFTAERPAIQWSEAQLEESATISPSWEYSDLAVAGVSYYQDAIRWASATVDDEITQRYALALLEFEPDNPHDKKAIKVTMQGHLVGHIGRGDQRDVAPIMRRIIKKGDAPTCVAKFVGGGQGMTIGIRLDIG